MRQYQKARKKRKNSSKNNSQKKNLWKSTNIITKHLSHKNNRKDIKSIKKS